MRTLLFSIVLALFGTAYVGCSANQVADANTLFNRDVAIVRAVIQAQPPGPKRDQWLAVLDAAQSYESLAVILSQLATNNVPVPTTKLSTAGGAVAKASTK